MTGSSKPPKDGEETNVAEEAETEAPETDEAPAESEDAQSDGDGQ